MGDVHGNVGACGSGGLAPGGGDMCADANKATNGTDTDAGRVVVLPALRPDVGICEAAAVGEKRGAGKARGSGDAEKKSGMAYAAERVAGRDCDGAACFFLCVLGSATGEAAANAAVAAAAGGIPCCAQGETDNVMPRTRIAKGRSATQRDEQHIHAFNRHTANVAAANDNFNIIVIIIIINNNNNINITATAQSGTLFCL